MLVILDMLATGEYSWGIAGCSGWNRKAKLEKKASPVLILSKRNMWSLELTVYDARQTPRKSKTLWRGRRAGRCYTSGTTKKRRKLCCRTGKASVLGLGATHPSLPLSTEQKVNI